ncbi:hypothetical protein XPA_005089 [Xanthoria parietina]
MTYKLPTPKVAIRPILSRREVWRCQMVRSGSSSMMTSVKMLGKLAQRKSPSLSIQKDPGSLGFQLAANGRHAENAVMPVASVKAINTPIKMATVLRNLRSGKSR